MNQPRTSSNTDVTRILGDAAAATAITGATPSGATHIGDLSAQRIEIPVTLIPPQIPNVEIKGLIGRGGMGAVWRGTNTFLHRAVAVKTLLVPAGEAGHEFVRRFQREARILASLSHPHIVGCHDAGLLPDGSPFLVMEFIDGICLKDHVATHGPLRESEALRLIHEMALGLAHAHAQGIIHRDVKPENVLLARAVSTPDTDHEPVLPWMAKLVDLGLARPQETLADSALTLAGAVVGTPSAMAPEQFEHPDQVDFRVDIYGLGCTLYAALTGTQAYAGNTIGQIVAAKVSGQIPDITLARPQTSPAVVALLKTLLARHRDQRPSSWPACIAIISAARQAAGSTPVGGLTSNSKLVRAGLVLAGLAAAALLGLGIISALAPTPPPAENIATAATRAEIIVLPTAVSKFTTDAGDTTAAIQESATTAHNGIPVIAEHPAVLARATEPTWTDPVEWLSETNGPLIFKNWTLSEDGRNGWSGNDDAGKGIAGFKGSISRPLPTTTWRISTRIEPSSTPPRSGVCGLAIELVNGSLIAVALLPLHEMNIRLVTVAAANALSDDHEYLPGEITQPLGPVDLTVKAWNNTLTVSTGAHRSLSVGLSGAPQRVHLWIKKSKLAVRRDSGPIHVPFFQIATGEP